MVLLVNIPVLYKSWGKLKAAYSVQTTGDRLNSRVTDRKNTKNGPFWSSTLFSEISKKNYIDYYKSKPKHVFSI